MLHAARSGSLTTQYQLHDLSVLLLQLLESPHESLKVWVGNLTIWYPQRNSSIAALVWRFWQATIGIRPCRTPTACPAMNWHTLDIEQKLQLNKHCRSCGQMRKALPAVLLITFNISTYGRQNVPVSKFSDEDYWGFFQRSWQKHKDLFRTHDEQWTGKDCTK